MVIRALGCIVGAHLVIRSSIDRGSRIKVGNTTRLRSAPGRSWEMMCVRTVRSAMSAMCLPEVHCIACRQYIPFPWSGSTTSSSPLTDPALGSSRDERVPEELKNEPQSADMMGRKGTRGVSDVGKEVVEGRWYGGSKRAQRAEGRESRSRSREEKKAARKNDVGDEEGA